MKRILQFSLSLLFGVLIMYAVLWRFDLKQTIASVRSAQLSLLVLGLALMIASYFLRGARWLIWERSLSYWDSLKLILIGFMGNNVLPARLGEIVRAHCTSAKIGDDRGRTAAVASIAAERILDGLVLATFGVVGIALVSVNSRLRIGLVLVSLLFALCAVGLIVSIRCHRYLRALVAAANHKFPGHITAFAREKTEHFLDGFLPLGTVRRLVAAIAATFAIWTLELVFYYLVGRSVWPAFEVRTAVIFLVVVNFASLIPLTMGGIGTIEAVAPLFLISCGIASPVALAMVLLQHAGQYLFTTVGGALVYVAGGFYRIPLTDPKGKRAPQARAAENAAVAQAVMASARHNLGQLRETVDLRPADRNEVDLSIVIPAYDEQARLPRTVLETIRWCSKQNLEFELVLADDGSRDQTLALARLFAGSDGRIRALACPHAGKGAAVRLGVLNASGRYIMFMDADGATPLTEIPKLMSALGSGFDVAIGSRVMQHPGDVMVETSLHRKIIGRGFALFVNLLAIDGIGDTQCGFKMFTRDAAHAIFSRQKIAGFAFDVEVLYLARKLSLSIAEIPVNWAAQAGSKVNLVTDSIKMLWDISHIRWLHRSFQPRAAGKAEPALAVSCDCNLGSRTDAQ